MPFAELHSIEEALAFKAEHQLDYDVVSTLSGGIDSTTTAYITVKEMEESPLFLYIDYGSKVAQSEIRASLETCKRLDAPLLVVPFKDFMGMNKSFLMDNGLTDPEKGLQFWSEGRNAILALMAASVASAVGSEWVYLSISASDSNGGYVDTDQSFLDAVNLLIRHSFRNKVRVMSHLLDEDLDKYEVIERGEGLGIDWVAQTHSCSSSNIVCCNYKVCESCQHRLAGFILADKTDPFDPEHRSLSDQLGLVKEIYPDWEYDPFSNVKDAQ
jgi:queuosine biosynthesis protein QueC